MRTISDVKFSRAIPSDRISLIGYGDSSSKAFSMGSIEFLPHKTGEVVVFVCAAVMILTFIQTEESGFH